jgi:hypothetical protein
MPLMKRSRWVVLAVMSLWLLVALPSAAHAYIDPGVGSMIWQVAMAGILTAAYFGRRVLRWLGDIFRMKSTRPGSHDRPDGEQ